MLYEVITIRLPDDRLARGQSWRFPDGAAVRGRRHEPPVGGGDRSFCTGGKGCPRRSRGRSFDRGGAGSRGNSAAHPGVLAPFIYGKYPGNRLIT